MRPRGIFPLRSPRGEGSDGHGLLKKREGVKEPSRGAHVLAASFATLPDSRVDSVNEQP